MVMCAALLLLSRHMAVLLQPFRLPGGNGLFKIPLDYRPDDKAVERCKYWTAWKVRALGSACMAAMWRGV